MGDYKRNSYGSVGGEASRSFDPQIGAIEERKGRTPDGPARSKCHFVRTFITDQIFGWVLDSGC